MDSRFVIVGIRPIKGAPVKKKTWYEGKPLAAMVLLAAICLGCASCGLFIPGYLALQSARLGVPADRFVGFMDLANVSAAPGHTFWFGTDTMGRDIFSMTWKGGQISLFIGVGGAAISTCIAILFGTVSALSPKWLDGLLMRLTEILLSVPSLLTIILLQAVLGDANVYSITFVIGIAGWMSMAKVVRTEVRQIKDSGYVIAARCMGGGLFHILLRHLAPNFIASIMFMVVMDIRSAIIAESTLSFMGIGLPLETISWGSMLSLAERALLGGGWWMILIPGGFLVVTLMCVTEMGEYLRGRMGERT